MRHRALIIALAFALSPLWPAAALAQDAPIETGKRVIEDPSEGAAYQAAVAISDPASKAAALTVFAQQYPLSARKLEALQQAMAAFQQLNDTANIEPSARRVLAADSKDVRALALVVYLERTRAQDLKDETARAKLAKKAAEDSNLGLTALDAWGGPAGLSADDRAAVHKQLSAVFYGALGFDRLVQADYALARYFYLKAVEADPTDAQTDYQFAIVCLRAKPLDTEGFWWAAKAYVLAGAANASATQAQIDSLARESYRRYHGSEDGWGEIVLQAANQTAPPPGFTVSPPQSPAEMAVQAVKDSDPGDLTLPDWEYVLSFRDFSAANREAADRVWAAIQAKQSSGDGRLKLPIKVVSATRSAIDGAITDENRQAGRVDLHVILDKPLAQAPAPGQQLTVWGAVGKYTSEPFAFTMQKAEIAAE